jgi:hypothetical protein
VRRNKAIGPIALLMGPCGAKRRSGKNLMRGRREEGACAFRELPDGLCGGGKKEFFVLVGVMRVCDLVPGTEGDRDLLQLLASTFDTGLTSLTSCRYKPLSLPPTFGGAFSKKQTAPRHPHIS